MKRNIELSRTTQAEVVSIDEETGLGLVLINTKKLGPAPLNGSYTTIKQYAYGIVTHDRLTDETLDAMTKAELTTRTSIVGTLGFPLADIMVDGLSLRGITGLNVDQQEVCVSALCELTNRLKQGN